MILYTLECCFFQLVFLLAYDFFLRGETFFQWNRVYLLGTFACSWLLPFVQLEAFSMNLPSQISNPVNFIWSLDEIVVGPSAAASRFGVVFFIYMVLAAGSLIALLNFGRKILQIKQTKELGVVEKHKNYTKIIVNQDAVAFSFFSNIFIGKNISKDIEQTIIDHEMVHIRQWHSLDLLGCEIAKILFWFNPLVYRYQQRLSEIHEFIADAKVSQNQRKDHYKALLNQVFNTQQINFINQFLNQSLIKKRIVMLTKEKSSRTKLFKYTMIIPILLLFLVYSSCNSKNRNQVAMTLNSDEQVSTVVPFMKADKGPIFPGCENDEHQKTCFVQKIQEHVIANFTYPKEAQKEGVEGKVNLFFVINREGEITNLKAEGADEILMNEAKRIVNTIPKMKPGTHDGGPVEIGFSLPITFKL